VLPYPFEEIAWAIMQERRMEACRRGHHRRQRDGVRRRLARALVRAGLAIDPQAWQEAGQARR